MIKIYLANLGKYNEGKLVGSWLELPCTEEELQEKFVEIGVGHMDAEGNYVHGVTEVDEKGYPYVYEEYAIHDYECDIDCLEIKEYSNLEKLNELAEELEGLHESQIKELEALLEFGYVSEKDLESDSIEDILGNYIFADLSEESGSDEEKLGYVLAEMDGIESKMEEAGISMNYFDYEAYGRDALCGTWNIASNDIAFAE